MCAPSPAANRRRWFALWIMSLAFVSVPSRAADIPGRALPPGEEERQWAMLVHDLANRAAIAARADQAFHPAALLQPSDRDPLDVILRRTEALLSDLSTRKGVADLSRYAAGLELLKARNKELAQDDASARRTLFSEALRLRRALAFSNPLLDFGELVFLRRHRAIYNHMCDQFYGIAARPGGGLYVLSDPFGPQPTERDLLAESLVANGRLRATRLHGGPRRDWQLRYDGQGRLSGELTQGGSFLSPALSYDGRTLLFAYVECTGDREHSAHLDPGRGHWPEGRSYHLFSVNLDGSALRQLTDGAWNDFDPCWMPSGRIAFISERRGGYLRCGRVCPTFTVFDMAADGSDIRCLSFHETNEWGPTVNTDGLLLYTRWDYVDRHGCVAHGPWTMTPDGRDPRQVHGNYAARPTRPDMEIGLRPIPGSSRIVATAAPHHGQAFGSLIVIDPAVPDDDAMAPVRRLTPEIGFPESQRGTESYGEAWPLDDYYHLCAYDPAMSVPNLGPKGHYGIYLVDAFGNKELIFRDPEIGCHSPIPVKARPAPAVRAEMSVRVPANQPAEAEVVVLDTYQSQKAWPEGTRIKALRIFQILPLSVASAAVPHNTGIQIPQGADSVNLARSILGEVPVEEDGSAYFVVPARKELYFQALDAEGRAITSMRSATQFQPGEKASCQGCHESRRTAPQVRNAMPAALKRPPSRPIPGPDGTNPFSYPRLVQPVLDRHCAACHERHPEKAPRLDTGLVAFPGNRGMNVPTTYYASYVSLAPKYGFYNYGGKNWSDPKWYRTSPGEFGARASRLMAMLTAGHHDVRLPPEDLRRLILWLDSCSLFYGVYEPDGGAAQRRGEIARPTLE